MKQAAERVPAERPGQQMANVRVEYAQRPCREPARPPAVIQIDTS
jgi:hypothetical protein